MKKILVIGATGMIGHQLWFHLRRQFGAQVFATIRGKKEAFSQFKIFDDPQVYEGLDVTDFSKVQELLETIRPSEILNCVGITLRKPEIKDLGLVYDVNSTFPRRLSQWAQNQGARLIQFSTDCVFDGKKGFYTESDIPLASDTYGKSKLLGELVGPHCLTLRFPVIGRELSGKTELLEWFLAQKGKEVRGFSAALYSGVTTLVAAEEVIRIIEKFPDLTGLFHVANAPISKYDLLCLLNKHFNLGIVVNKDNAIVTNKVLVSDKYRRETGFNAQNWDEMLRDLVAFSQIKYEV